MTAAVSLVVYRAPVSPLETLFVCHLTAILNATALFLVILNARLTAVSHVVSHWVSPLGTLFVFHLILTAILNASALFLLNLTAMAILIVTAVLVAVHEILILV